MDSFSAVHRNILRDRKSLKIAWVKTSDLSMQAASEVIGTKVLILEKYTFVVVL